MRVRRAEAEAKWRGLVTEQEQSGKSVAEFCRERGIARSKLYFWRQRCVGTEATSRFVRLKVAPLAEADTVEPARRGIEVRLTCGRS
jgi:transposase-like protein